MIYDIGPLELDDRRRELSREPRIPVRMTEKAIEVLLALLERHGGWVSKDELLKEVWAGVLFMSDNVLAQRLKEIRDCLEKNGVPPPILEYKRGRGYRFVPPFELRLPTTALTPDDLKPFAPGPPIMHPVRFFGRERELSDLFPLWQHLPLLNAAVIGPRRSGKTSLLLYSRSLGTVPLQHLRPDQQVNRRHWVPNPSRLHWVFVNFQSPQLSSQAGVLQHILRDLGLSAPNPCDLDRFYEVVSEDLEAPAVILMDEIGVAMQAFDDLFWTSLRALTLEVEGKLGFVVAATDAVTDLARHKRRDSPFFNIFGHTVTLGPLTEAEARALIASSPTPFPSNDVEWILQASHCWPYFLQILCHKRLSALRNGEAGHRWQEEGLQMIEEHTQLEEHRRDLLEAE
jgi:DNA-binding winged helix-turn-helix (wHTH) protein